MVVVGQQQQCFTLLSPGAADADANAGSDGNASEVKRTLRTFFFVWARNATRTRSECDAIKLLNKMRANNKQKRGKGGAVGGRARGQSGITRSSSSSRRRVSEYVRGKC